MSKLVHHCSEKRQILSGVFWFLKKAKHIEKSHFFTIWLQKSQIGNPGSKSFKLHQAI